MFVLIDHTVASVADAYICSLTKRHFLNYCAMNFPYCMHFAVVIILYMILSQI